MARVIVCGGRDYQNWPRLVQILDAAVARLNLEYVIHGGAAGADTLAEAWCKARNVPFGRYRAEWGRLGKAAGHIRNERMIVEGKPDLVIAFPGDRGTANMVKQAEAAGIKVHRIDWPEGPDPYPDEPDPTGQMELRI